MKCLKKINLAKDKNKVIYFAFCAYLVLQLLAITSLFFGNDIFELVLKICRYMCYGVFTFEILIDRQKISKIELCLILLGILIWGFSKNRSILITLLIIISLKKLEFNKLLKLSCNVLAISFSIIVVASLLKIIPDWVYMRGSIARHSLGFLYPTDCSSIFLMITLLLLYNNSSDIPFYQIGVLEIINILLFIYTNGRLSFILINLVLLIMLMLKIKVFSKYLFKKELIKKMKIVGYIIPVFFLILTNILIFLIPTNNSIVNKLDLVLSHRISYAEKAYQKYGLHLFGKKIEWHGWGGYSYVDNKKSFEYNFVDNSYAKVLLDYGIVFTIVVIYAYVKMLLYCCDKKDMVLYITLIIVLMWSFVEPYIISVSRNIYTISFILLLKENPKNSRWLCEKVN